MKNVPFEILPVALPDQYCDCIGHIYLNNYQELKESELSISTFSFYTSVAAVFSSKIEGENIDLDSYIKHKRFHIEFLPDYTRKTDDLYNAYQFAKTNTCNQANIEQAHRTLTVHILPVARQNKIRTGNVYATTADGRIEYVALSSFPVKMEMEKFYYDLTKLMTLKLSAQGIFFFASLLHLNF